MEDTIKKTNTQILKEIQGVVDDINKEKEDIEKMLQVVDYLERKGTIEEVNKEKEEVDKRLQIINSLEKKYYDLIDEAKGNNKK
jgi:hypothetical protein